MKIKNSILALVLLSVFLTRLVVVSVHTHEPIDIPDYECEQCAHHNCHTGHLIEFQLNAHDCLLCQLCQLPFMQAFAVLVIAGILLIKQLYLATIQINFSSRFNTILGRAPPVI